MKTFEIKEEFMLDGQAVKIISGAIHYFRLAESQWEDSLYNLKAMGANTVETYIPWNAHEPVEGQFDFTGMLNIVKFVKLAKKLGLMVILRPSAYICAEWEFGGLPAWLLKHKGLRLRSTDSIFMEKVENYFKVLLPRLTDLQITHGGPVIMMQVENEYGSYGMEKDYLRQTKALMEKYGIDVPMFTADGAWQETLDAGSLIEDDVFVTGNFGSDSKKNAGALKDFMAAHGKQWPLMCMEYWDGWFNRWGEPIIKRDAKDLADQVKEMLELGSVNIYMFHGGTNFGFYNGCSARDTGDLPQITSYDYDAILTEEGYPTEKYYLLQKAIHEVCPDAWQAEPRVKTVKDLGEFPVNLSTSLLAQKDKLKQVNSVYPMTMEDLDSAYGYCLYELDLPNYQHENKLKIVEASDRVHAYLDGQLQTIQYKENMGQDFQVESSSEQATMQLDLLVENLGRVNYGFKFNAPSQSKGIRGGVIQDLHFHQGYTQYPLDFSVEMLEKIDYELDQNPAQASFYKAKLDLNEIADAYIDCSSYGKGVVIVNGVNLGRYWELGPTLSLYCPKDFLKLGKNEIVIFETEGIEISTVKFSSKAIVM